MVGPAGISGFHQAMRKPIQRSVINAVDLQLSRMSRRDVELDADTLVGLLEKVLTWKAPLDAERLDAFVNALLELMVEEGPGTDFRQQERCIAVTDAAVNRLAELGSPTADLRLAQARYLAIFANNGTARLDAIRAALRSSQTDGERLRTLLTLAKYHIDASNYRQAQRILSRCEELARATPDLHILLPDVMTAWGMSYFYASRSRAEPYFQEAIRLGKDMPPVSVVTNTLIAAWHYLGRVQVARGNWQAALDLYVKARPVLKDAGKGEAFFHLRLADILIELDAFVEAHYHLRKSGSLFRAVQEASTGEVQLNLALARLSIRKGDRRTAAAILKAAVADARSHNYPRGELKCEAELLKLLLLDRRLPSALSLVARMIVVLVAEERWGGIRYALTELQTAVGMPRGRSRRSPGARGSVISCPCGADHGRPDE